MSLETELLLEFVNAKLTILSLPLQHTKSDQRAGHVMPLRPLRTGLTAGAAQLILAHPDHGLDWGPDAIQTAHLGGCQCAAIRRLGLGAVSDDHDVQASCEPAGLCPLGMAPIGPERVAAEAAVLLEAADDRPPIVANPLQEGLRGIPGLKEHRLRAAAPMMAGLAEQLQGQRRL